MRTTEFLAALCLLLTATAFSEERNPNAALLSGNPVFHKQCAKCHGGSGTGRHFSKAPSLISEKNAAASADDLQAIITNGKGNMPAFSGKISATDIDAIVQQIKAANTK